MPMLRMFGPAREAAGTAKTEIAGRTAGEVADAACRRFGPELAAVVAGSRLWVNGEPASRATTVGEHDEVAVIPPVSGGC